MTMRIVRWRKTTTAYWVWFGLRGFWECRSVNDVPMAIYGIDFFAKQRRKDGA